MALLPDRVFNVRIKLRNDSHANWEKQPNFVPMDGEIIIYDIDDEHKFQMIKIGDGSKELSNLPFINDFYTKKEIDTFIEELQKADLEIIQQLNNEIDVREQQVNDLWYETTEIRSKIEKLHPVELKDIAQYDGGQLVEIVFECNPYNGPFMTQNKKEGP